MMGPQCKEMTEVSKIIGIQEPLGYNKVLLYSGEDNEKSTQPYANHPRNNTGQASCKEKNGFLIPQRP